MLKIKSTAMPFDPREKQGTKFRKYAKLFYNTFGLHLEQVWNNGFVMNDFRDIVIPEGKDLKAYLDVEFGDGAYNLIEELLKPVENPYPQTPEAKFDMDIPLEMPDKRPLVIQRCEYSFPVSDIATYEGMGYYFDGLLIHREHFRYPPYSQIPDGSWTLSTKEGIRIYTFNYFLPACKIAGLCARAVDFTAINSFNMTTDQYDALRRVMLWWHDNGRHTYDCQ